MSVEEKLKLLRLVDEAKEYILKFLQDKPSCKRSELDKYIFQRLSLKLKNDGTITHRHKPEHGLAYILAYKQLESTGEIEIQRPVRVPFPMTDWETVFSLKEREMVKNE